MNERMNRYVMLAGPFNSCLPLCTPRWAVAVGARLPLLCPVFSCAQQRMAHINICGAGLKGTTSLEQGPCDPASSGVQSKPGAVVLRAHCVGEDEIT